jgi:hypothetical protein
LWIERKTPERKAFYQLAWHLGASQSDLANLLAPGKPYPFSGSRTAGITRRLPAAKLGRSLCGSVARRAPGGVRFSFYIRRTAEQRRENETSA